MKKNIINIGILAHVDAGKTTLSESFLYLGGIISTPGNVDKGTAQSDFMAIEKERGISVRSATSTFFWEDVQINLIDTPGHIDFSADVERSLRILDAAVLVISAVEGVQAHTENIWHALKEHSIPTIIFINKIDRIGADTQKVLAEIRNELSENIVVLQQSNNDGEAEASIASCWNNGNVAEEITESIANQNDNILEKYLDDQKLTFDELDNELKIATGRFQLLPILMGAAKILVGVKELLNAIVNYMPEAVGKEEIPFSALVFRIDHNNKLGKIVGVKLFNGQLSAKDIIRNKTQEKDEKVNQIKRYRAGKFEDCSTIKAGDIAAIFGLKNAQVGDVLGSGDLVPKEIKLNSPLLIVQVKAEKDNDYPALAEALSILSAEDPALEFEWLREDKELHVKIMGWIQIEVIEMMLEQRFNIKAKFDDPTVIYKESPKTTAEGFARYWMPKPCWAIIKLKIEPGEPDSGVVYKSEVSVNDIQKKYQNEVERAINKALRQGTKGWEVTDLKITLIEGEDHTVHSNPGDFIIATPMAIMDGLVNTGTKFLEPIIWFSITAPDELLGAITSDIINMRGTFESPIIQNGKFTLEGTMPVASSMDYPVKLSSRSGGRAKIKTRFHSYNVCADEYGVTKPFKGISPLDESKYILKARKALTEGIKGF
ncbi:MAG: TetM/TetW/TetO/TetS family tetracycline resistance ribosomal protection protein [Bacteroidota bacterium]